MLAAYIDGAVRGAEAEAFRVRLAREPELRRLFAAYLETAEGPDEVVTSIDTEGLPVPRFSLARRIAGLFGAFEGPWSYQLAATGVALAALVTLLIAAPLAMRSRGAVDQSRTTIASRPIGAGEFDALVSSWSREVAADPLAALVVTPKSGGPVDAGSEPGADDGPTQVPSGDRAFQVPTSSGLAALPGLFAPAPPDADVLPAAWSSVYRLAALRVVFLTDGRRYAAGTIVEQGGWIVTDRRVAGLAQKTSDGRRTVEAVYAADVGDDGAVRMGRATATAEVVREAPETGLALLRITLEPSTSHALPAVPPAPFAEDEGFAGGVDQLMIVGSTANTSLWQAALAEPSRGAGAAADLSATVQGEVYDAGAPLLDAAGRIVGLSAGLASAAPPAGEATTAVKFRPAAVVRSFVETAIRAAEESSTQ